ncbi:MAG: hypothetical protein ACRDKI_05080 [Solirubrobacterales bacterium]
MSESDAPPPAVQAQSPGRGHYVFPPGEQPYWVPTDPPPRPNPPAVGGPPAFVQPQQVGPGNDQAVISIVSGSISLGLLFLSGGIASPLTLIASGLAVFFGQRGQDNIRSGKTTEHRDTAVAGFWVGITGVILSTLAILAWLAFLVIISSSDGWSVD